MQPPTGQSSRAKDLAGARPEAHGPSAAPERGLYIWGGVGRGKNPSGGYLYDSLALERKLRVHFHRFMQRVHAALTQHSGAKNPLEVVADDIADEALVLCFDEFFVSDIGDAMILGGLIDALFRRGVTLVATSNIRHRSCTVTGYSAVVFCLRLLCSSST
ncbi:MAG: hypothetical protein CM15mP89_0830 [Gammaproteobacteria bacterium]|nr:MAG: hypothetical protein CM15mP89_0830 [Gammaproteobacteria bacterium]